MNKKFNDSSIVIHYIQQFLSENYNDGVKINGDYYVCYDMNYGLAHFIAKYLDVTYPILDRQSMEDYNNIGNNSIRSIKEPISIMNYFLCSNTKKRLKYSDFLTDLEVQNLSPDKRYKYQSEELSLYRKIYNEYMILKYDQEAGYYVPNKPKYINKQDLPLFCEHIIDNQYNVNNEIIFTMDSWGISKEICEMDDLVTSYLLGRTITPNSSMEDIYYVQKLLIRDREITRDEKGIWCKPGNEGGPFDLTQTIINFQRKRVDPLRNNRPIFVTGYFDIYTESFALEEVGEPSNGILGL